MTAFLKTLPQTIVGLALLAALTVMGYTGHLSPADTYTAIMGIIGLVGATGLYVLASNWGNMNALPHLICGVGIVVAIVLLGLHNTFNSNQVLAVLGLLLTGTAGSIGAVAAANNPPPAATSSAMPLATVPANFGSTQSVA